MLSCPFGVLISDCGLYAVWSKCWVINTTVATIKKKKREGKSSLIRRTEVEFYLTFPVTSFSKSAEIQIAECLWKTGKRVVKFTGFPCGLFDPAFNIPR